MQNPTEYILLALMHGASTTREGAESILAEHDAIQLAKAIEAARGEYLTDATGDETDEAYNRGVADAIAAIGALGERKP
jgi:hypothetical protein